MSEKNEWKPIESAPKDGSRVLIWHPDYCAPITAQWYGSEGWKLDSDISPFWMQPTHWMPLPAAPGSTSSAPGDAQDERQADACPRCDGSGEITVMSDNSPDAHDVNVCCDHCQGSGAAVDAAKFLAAALSGEKYRHMQLWAEYRNFHRSLCARFGYGHDEVHFRRDLVSLEEAIAAKVAAPAAGDALDAARYRALVWVCTQGYDTLDAVCKAAGVHEDISPERLEAIADAALAAQVPQQGEA